MKRYITGLIALCAALAIASPSSAEVARFRQLHWDFAVDSVSANLVPSTTSTAPLTSIAFPLADIDWLGPVVNTTAFSPFRIILAATGSTATNADSMYYQVEISADGTNWVVNKAYTGMVTVTAGDLFLSGFPANADWDDTTVTNIVGASYARIKLLGDNAGDTWVGVTCTIKYVSVSD